MLTIWLNHMVNEEKNQSTEQQILAAAKKVFIQKGMAGARMQDIANEAGINKALLHYYFRSKEKLFEVIFYEAAARLFPRINEVLTADLPLFEKIDKFCNEYLSIVMENPHLPLFVLYEIGQNPERFIQKVMAGSSRPQPGRLLEQINQEVVQGRINPVNPIHLLLNMISLTLFPFVAKPMLQANLGISEEMFMALMEQRRKEVPRFIIDAIKK